MPCDSCAAEESSIPLTSSASTLQFEAASTTFIERMRLSPTAGDRVTNTFLNLDQEF